MPFSTEETISLIKSHAQTLIDGFEGDGHLLGLQSDACRRAERLRELIAAIPGTDWFKVVNKANKRGSL